MMEIRWRGLWLGSILATLLLPTAHPAAEDDIPTSSLVLSDAFKFTRNSYNVSIPENAMGKTFVTPEEKMGVQRGEEDLEVRFKIVNGDRDKFFKAEERLVGDFWFLLLRTRTGNTDVLNRERKDRYVLQVRATATKRDGKKTAVVDAETTVIVTVLDKNDLNPLFYPTDYEETISEDVPLHQSILRVSAEDADLGRNGELYYSFQEPTEQFAVHPTTGVVTLTRPLRYSDRSLHQLTVLAQDRGSVLKGGGKPSAAQLRIIVKQVNLYGPEMYVHHLPDIVENSNTDIYAIVRVMDRDEGIHGKIKSLEIVDGDPDGHFRITRSQSKTDEFNIEVLKLLDRETAPQGYNLTLRAIDSGIPPRQTYKYVPVHLADLNDNAPVFDREIYEVDIPETAPVNSPIIRLKVSDADQGRNAQVFLEIVGGNEGNEFNINPDTGMLYTAVALDAESKAFYTLTVSAIDQGNAGTRKQSSAKVKINVVDANDNDPLFEATEVNVTINENEPAGAAVIKVNARDRDSGENAYISYSIANLNPVPFEIDHFTGSVRTTQVLDYESMRREYILRIRASDWGVPYRRQTEMQLRIILRDVNDNRPQFEKVDCVGNVPRLLPIGSEIMTLSAIDFDAGNIISYRTVSGNEDGCFSLDSTSGVLSVTCDLADVSVNERIVNVTATDGTHFADVTSIRMQLVNTKRVMSNSNNGDDTGNFQCRDTGVARRLTEVIAAAEKNNNPSSQEEFAMMPSRYGENVHTPEWLTFPVHLEVNESAPLGTVLTKLRARDRDLGYNGKLIFGISSGDEDSVFRLDPDTGELKIIGFLDRERETEYLLNVTVSDLGRPMKSTYKVLPVNVLDVNDNAPKFQRTLASFRVTEKARNGTVIFRVNATDADLGRNAEIMYSLVTDTDDFKVDPVSGMIFVAADLDREKQDLYELKIRARDCGGDMGDPASLHSDALVRVSIDDVNDNPPKFSLSTYSVKAREDIPEGTVIAIVSATDPDLGQGGEITYSLFGEAEVYLPFKIDHLTGTVRSVKRLDFEERQVHSLTVRATDRGSPPLTSEATLVVEVVDVNENLHAPLFDDFVVAASVLENQPIGTLVTTIKATDADLPGDDSRIGYYIRAGDGIGYFNIDDEGNIRTLAVLDAETKTHFWLTVVAQDHGVAPLHSSLQVFISVGNVNDNVPLSVEAVYYPHVAENSAAGTPVVQLYARDDDLDSQQMLSYRITAGNPESFFTIDSSSGLISTTGRRLDRETQAEHILEVTISDDGSPSLSSTTRVVVAVDDVNDNAPEFEQAFYKIVIPRTRHQDAPLFQNGTGDTELALESLLEIGTWESFTEDELLGEALFRVHAVDRDIGNNAELHYSIKSGRGKGKFGIHPSTGTVYSQRSFAAGQEYDLLVKATDYGSPNKSSTARVSVTVKDIPEDSPHHPVIRQPDQRVQVTESDTVGFLVALVQATDEDGDMLWYYIVGGDPRSEFVISGDKGSVLVAKQLDREVQSEYNLTISVTDGVHTVLTQLYVTVMDINEHRPWFTQNLYSANVSESSAVGTEIIHLQATDEDQDSKALMYSLHSARSPASLSAFKVDYQTGVVTIVQSLDRESIAEHLLTVMVKDQGTPAKRNFARVVIHVYDANDHAPEFSTAIIQGRVFETADVGSSVVTVLAVDKDHGNNAMITYSITSGNVGNAFTIDPLMGTIRVAKELDMNSIAEYMLIVKAVDGGSTPLSSTLPVHIMVVMADNAAPRFVKREVAAELYENEPAGTVVKHLEARSTSSLLFELIRGDAQGHFSVEPSTGVVTTRRPLDYETNRVFNLSVTATSMAGAKAVCHVIVHVLDRNDNAPRFVQDAYEGWVAEDSPVGSLVLTNGSVPLVIKASDADSELNSLLQYDIVEAGPRRMFHIDSSTGAIRTVQMLDYETMPEVVFNVRVSDLGKPRLSSETTAKVRINILDTNDCVPSFTQKEYKASVLMPTFTNVAVIQLEAKDGDSTNLTRLSYEILTGNSENIYAMNSSTGVITVRDTVRGARTSPHRLKVSVSDGRFSSEAHVSIQWDQSQHSGLMFQRQLYQGSVLENSTKVATVAVVNVVGSQLNEHLVFTILNPSPLFQIGRTSGALRTTGRRFDRELQEHYQLIVQARSEEYGRDSPQVAHVRVNVTVLDINDNCPMFVNLPYYAVVSVDAHKGDVITKVHAIDLDKGENGEVRYELSKGHGELFRVDRKSGEISLKQGLEGHTKDYQLIITAYDGGMSPCSTEVQVNVKVMDRSMPVFDKQFYTVSTPEDIEVHTPLAASIRAESPLDRKLIYSIVSGNHFEEFAVDFNTASDVSNGPCVLYVVDELDYETMQQYALTLRATDSVSGVYAEVLVSVIVTDVNDSPPEFPFESYNVSFSEASPFGSLVLKVVAKDNDTGLNGLIRYSIKNESGNSSDYFHVDAEDGSVYLKQSLDHEVQKSHHLVIAATDSGKPSLSTTVHVWITVVDMNDNAPKFEKQSYTAWLSEEATRGQFVTVVSASDADLVDHGRLVYSIVGGNPQQTFSVDTNSGIITVINLQKLTETRSHKLNVSVSDGVYTSFTRVDVELTAANQHSPAFEKSQYEARIGENLLSGTKVIRVTAHDRDAGAYGQVSYAIPSHRLGEIFYIGNLTGEIWTRTPLDREAQKVYEIPVMAVDAGGRSGFATVRVRVADDNDNPPVFQLYEYKACIHADLQPNAGFLNVLAVDPDEDLNAEIEYSIYETESSGVKEIFSINRRSGALSLLKSLVPYENQMFQFFVRATDQGSPPLHADVPVDVYVMGSSDSPPLFQQRDQKFFMSENAVPGSVITRVKLISDVPVTYRLMGGGGSLFTIDTEGEISLTGALDRESAAAHLISVLALTDSSPPLTALTEITLQVLDENDNAPQFDSDRYQISVAENVQEGTPILKVHATDLDAGSNGEVRYSLRGGDIFTVDAYTGWITTLVALDKETTPSYQLTVVAIDGGSPSRSATTQVFVELVDYNDNPPVFTQDSYVAAVNEDALPGTVVVQVSVNDLDREVSSPVEFHVTAGDRHAQFAVRATGEVYVARQLDREQVDSYHLTVLATDGKFVALASLQVDILDANDQQPYCLRYRYQETISEGVSPGTYVLTVLATDADLEPKLKFFLTGTAADHFSLDRTTGELKTARLLDREQTGRYQLTAHVQDKDWECVSHIEVLLSDLNDNSPTFASRNYTATLAEDAQIGTLVTKMHATDNDIGMNRKIRYHLLDSADGHFKIASDSGIITLAKPLDRETQAAYNLTVKATDQGAPQQLWSITALTVIVLDVNDNPPEFVSRSYNAVVPEITAVNTEVAHVLATSLDTGVNAEIVYSIIGGNEHGKFYINEKTGVITIAQQLDYERAHDYLLTVQATDLGTPPLSNQALVNVTVTDNNDNQPIFTQQSYSARVSEDIPIGDSVIQVTATDLDSGKNGEVSYQIERGDRHQQFYIDPSTGTISVSRPLDREMVSSYVLQIRATDNGIPRVSNLAMVNIDVLDINDNPPLFMQSNYTAIVQEDKKPGWGVTKLTVSDADIAPNGAPYTFEILSGDVGGTFRVEPDGMVRTAAKLNYKLQSTYLLHIRVFDNGSPILYSDTWLLVKVIEESQFPPSISPLDIWVGAYLDRFPGGEMGRVHATDPDQYDTLTFGLATKTPLFNINPVDGVLTAEPGLDTGRYNLNVTVTDGKYTSHANVRVTVEAVWEDMLQQAYSIRLNGITPHNFILSQRKGLLRALKSTLMKDTALISVQEAKHGYLDVLLSVKGGVEVERFNEALQSIGLNGVVLNCECLNEAICRQRIQLESERILTFATDVTSFVAPAHTHDLYCACKLGYAGDRCEEIVPAAADCACAAGEVCMPQPTAPGYTCLAPPLCSSSTNHTCPPPPPPHSPPSITSSIYSITWEELVAIGIALATIFLLVILFICYRRCRNTTRVTRLNKSPPVLNPDIKRTSKLSNLEVTPVTQLCPQRPVSYAASCNNEIYTPPLNNLDTLRSYGSAGDELENVPPDYLRNLNRNHTNNGHKINNDLKRASDNPPRAARRSLSCVEDDASRVADWPHQGHQGYHWDCSDWVRPSQTPLPNITEVPGSEVPDSSSFHSNESNESPIATHRLLTPVDPARDLATLDEELYLTYRSECDDDEAEVIPYGFPRSYPSHSDLSTNVCDIEDSDVPS